MHAVMDSMQDTECWAHIHTVKTNVLPQHIIEVQYNGLKIGLFLCAVIAHFFVL